MTYARRLAIAGLTGYFLGQALYKALASWVVKGVTYEPESVIWFPVGETTLPGPIEISGPLRFVGGTGYTN